MGVFARRWPTASARGAGPWLLVPLVLAGSAASPTGTGPELAGVGDVRWYAFVQFFTLLIIPVVLLLFPARWLSTQSLLAVLAWYAIAKALEHLDGPIYQANGVVSGHTLKHLAASLGALVDRADVEENEVRSPTVWSLALTS